MKIAHHRQQFNRQNTQNIGPNMAGAGDSLHHNQPNKKNQIDTYLQDTPQIMFSF
ncbi:hypothetical protein [Heyndrickxia vini]|uniref:Uncharacterized protein n=1 Tax=Heyndrickxia vini TaxID=1476025 RepID=A0ABX7E6X8_9BACI|nr:hypothetical protein [Heyndrickxia vini]QQZ11331.1 hypothetical protein I5776_10785 [Heyndrickxia vini]